MITLLEATVSVPTLPIVWFLLVTVLWLGYFFLEGFDYGVAMLIPVLGKNDKDKRVLVNTIGPVWDGNEVWLLTAGGAMFAAFPGWYASLFSGLYLPLLLVLVGLILRGVAFEEIPIREQPPTVPELRLMLAACGGENRRLFNTSGLDYRALGIKDKLPTMTNEEAILLLASNGNLIKRPFFLTRSSGVTGVKETEWEILMRE